MTNDNCHLSFWRGLIPLVQPIVQPTRTCFYFHRAHCSQHANRSNRGGTMRLRVTCCLFSLLVLVTGTARADEVTDWNRIMLDAMLVPPAVAPPVAERQAAIVHAAIFDA